MLNFFACFFSTWSPVSLTLCTPKLATSFFWPGVPRFQAMDVRTKTLVLPWLRSKRQLTEVSGPSGPEPHATAILSRYAVAPHSVALRFPVLGGVSPENRYTPWKRPCSAYLFSSKGVSHFKLLLGRWRGAVHGVPQLHCRLSRCNGALRSNKPSFDNLFESFWSFQDFFVTSGLNLGVQARRLLQMVAWSGSHCYGFK